jgi:hypothetical protein
MAAASYAHLALSGKALSANIRKVGTSGKAFDKLVHTTAIACLIHSLPEDKGGHLNATAALNLVKAMPPGSQRGMLVAWFRKFSNVRITANKDEKTGDISFAARLVKPEQQDFNDKVDPNKANLTPFYDVQEDRNLTPFMFTEDYLARALGGIVKRFDDASTEGRIDPNLPDADKKVIEAIRNLSEAVAKRAEKAKQDAEKAKQAAANRTAARATRKPTPNPNAEVRKRERAAAKDAAKDAAQMAGAH